MRDLASPGNFPAIRVMQGVADLTFFHATGIIVPDLLQTERAAVHFIKRNVHTWFAFEQAP